MFPAHVPVNVTAALDDVVGVTVYFTLPQPAGGVDAVTDDQVPANAWSEVPELGEVGVELSPSFLLLSLSIKSQPPEINIAATRKNALNRDFMILLIVTYHFDLYGF
jgi:hypothetical protein